MRGALKTPIVGILLVLAGSSAQRPMADVVFQAAFVRVAPGTFTMGSRTVRISGG